MLEQKSPYTDVTEFMPYAVATAKRLIADNNMQGLQLLIDDLCQLSTDIDSFVDEIPDAVDKYHKLMAQKAALEEQIRGQKKSLDDLERLRSEEFGVNNAMHRLDSIACDDFGDVVESKDIGGQTQQQIDSFFGGDDGFDFDVHDDGTDGAQQPRMGQASAFGATYDDDDDNVAGDSDASIEDDADDGGQGYAMESQTSEQVPFDEDGVAAAGQMVDGSGVEAQYDEQQQYGNDACDACPKPSDDSEWGEQETADVAVQPDPFSQYGQEQDASDDDYREDDDDDEPQALSMDAVMQSIEESSGEQNDDDVAADDQDQDDEQPRRRKRKRGKRGSGKGTANDGEQRDDGNEHINDIEGLSNIDEILGDNDFSM